MSKKVVFGTHLRGGRPTVALRRELEFLIRVVQKSKLPDLSVLILEQPTGKRTLEGRREDKASWEKAARELEGPLTLVYDLGYPRGEPVTLAWNKLHRHAFECLQADVFVYTDPNPS